MPWPSQALCLSRIEWEHFPCLASLMRTPKFVSFPSSCTPPLSSWLVSTSLRLQVPEEIPTHVSLESQVLMEECSPSISQDTNHNPKDVESSNLSTCPSYTLCYLFLDLSIFQKVLES